MDGSDAYQQYLEGDDGGLSTVIRLHQQGLMLYLNTYVGNLHVAEELTEDTFVKLAIKKPRFRGESAFGTWLYAIGRRVALDYLRKNWYHSARRCFELFFHDTAYDTRERGPRATTF